MTNQLGITFFQFRSDLNIHPGFIRKKDSRLSVGCINWGNNGDARGPDIIYSTTVFPQDRGNLGRSWDPTSAHREWKQDSRSHFLPWWRLSDFFLKPAVGLE